jgi:histidyl-tRNA synthetase
MKPSIPKGTRDFSPEVMIKRDFIFDTIKDVFRIYGYQPVETPAMENLSTLLGKYGEEGDKLLFRILNSGDFLNSLTDKDLQDRESVRLSSLICERGLRYDLTVPFARYVVQHREEIIFPFRRYQIQPVWRADRPQKGRYREFFQCDVDIIGSDSLLNEYELVRIIDDIFNRLKINVVIKLNNRKILTGIAEIIEESSRITDITVAIDKIDKIGIEGVNEELKMKGISAGAISKLQPIIQLKGCVTSKLEKLETILANSETGLKGVEEVRGIFSLTERKPLSAETELDLTLARGLDYYTGAIIEVKAQDIKIGSICGGGRYDDLTGVFGMEGVSGVGISFGADRIYDVMSQLNLFDEQDVSGTKVLILNFGKKEIEFGLKIRDMLLDLKISSEIYPDPVKLKKQMSYADSRKIPYIILAGEDEIVNNGITIREMATGEQKRMNVDELTSYLRSKLNL